MECAPAAYKHNLAFLEKEQQAWPGLSSVSTATAKIRSITQLPFMTFYYYYHYYYYCIVSYTMKTNFLSYEYQLCHATITRTSSIMDLGVFFDSKLHFHIHVHYVFSECIKLLGLIRSITYRFSSLECLYVLYCDGPLLHNERLLTDVISTVTNTEKYPITRNR
jgi:hypothetical protein